MFRGDFKPGFRIELHIKDLGNAINAAHAVSSPVLMTGQLMEIMQALKADGLEKKDHSCIVKYYEKISNVTLSLIHILPSSQKARQKGEMVLWITMVREPFREEPYWLWEVRECSRRFLRIHPSPC